MSNKPFKCDECDNFTAKSALGLKAHIRAKHPAEPNLYFPNGGIAPKYETPEELQKAINDYFDNGIKSREVIVGPPNNRRAIYVPMPTITGLVLHCGFDSRQSFYDYEEKEDFSYTIKRARAFIEKEYEELLQSGLGSGAIFALKNFKWKDTKDFSGNIRTTTPVPIFDLSEETDDDTNSDQA